MTNVHHKFQSVAANKVECPCFRMPPDRRRHRPGQLRLRLRRGRPPDPRVQRRGRRHLRLRRRRPAHRRRPPGRPGRRGVRLRPERQPDPGRLRHRHGQPRLRLAGVHLRPRLRGEPRLEDRDGHRPGHHLRLRPPQPPDRRHGQGFGRRRGGPGHLHLRRVGPPHPGAE